MPNTISNLRPISAAFCGWPRNSGRLAKLTGWMVTSPVSVPRPINSWATQWAKLIQVVASLLP